MAFNGTGSNVTSLNATNIASGTVPTARLASGTANSTTFLRGDSTWAAPGGTGANVQTFTSSGTWTKPSTGTMCAVVVLGGGGGGGRSVNEGNYQGGDGGRSAFYLFNLSDLASTVSVVVGSGGSSGAYNSAGGSGGNTTFGGALAQALGGSGGYSWDGATERAPTARTGSIPTVSTFYGGAGLFARAESGAGYISTNALTSTAQGATNYSSGETQNSFGAGGATAGAAGSGNGAGGACGSESSGNGGSGSAGLCRVIVW